MATEPATAAVPSGEATRPRVRVSDLGEFIRFDSCERRFKLSFNKRAEARRLPFFERLFSPLDPVLQQAGSAAEDAWQEQLLEGGYRELAPKETVADDDGAIQPAPTTWSSFAEVAASLESGETAYGRQIELEGQIGAFDVVGWVDFILVEWLDGRPRIRLIEGKASRKDRTYHRIQVVCYLMLLRQILAESPVVVGGIRVAPDDVEIAVARIEEDTGEVQSLSELAPLATTEREEADLERLLAADGRLMAIIDTGLDDVPFQLNGKCDGCVFNIDCLSESGRQRRLELLGIEPSTSSALRAAGVEDIDDLGGLDLEGDMAAALHTRPGFPESLARLRERARARRSTLPRGEEDPDRYQVRELPGGGQGQLPSHEQDGDQLVRVYLAVDYDYTENRIGALTAHVTRSTHELHLKWEGPEGERQPDPTLHEWRRVARRDGDGKLEGFDFEDERELDGEVSRTVINVMPTPWTGRSDVDSGAEKVLIQEFFMGVVDAIYEVAAPDDQCRLHFYVWSRGEIARLVEACARTDSRLLSHLRELLGARESLEQLIFSSVAEEIDSRYGLGWTGRALVVASSLGWYGERFHWTRRLGGEEVQLDRVFTQDLFDFKTALGLNGDGSWAPDMDQADMVHRFEIRARHFDSLPAPYWRAMWGTLPDAHELNSPQVKGALQRYARAERRHVRAYLGARAEGLRWLEERVVFKNLDVDKEPIPIADLPRFDLGVHDVARASIDVLRLDSHVSAARWIAEHLEPVRERVAAGITLPVREVEHEGGGRLMASLDLESFEADEEALRALWAPDAFVRLTIRGDNPSRGQTLRQLRNAGVTAVLSTIDWDTGRVELEAIPGRRSQYIFSSASPDWAGEVMELATIDESPSDFVAGAVERRLAGAHGSPAVAWLDPLNPAIPDAPGVDEDELDRMRTAVESLRAGGGEALDPRQVGAIVDGLSGRLQLIQGPPGTGKTATTSIAVLARIALRAAPGQIVLISGPTHTAVDGLIARIAENREDFVAAADSGGLDVPSTVLVRVDPDQASASQADAEIRPTGCVRELKDLAQESVLLIAGTPKKLLQLGDTLRKAKTFPSLEDVTVDLVVDEASMMVFPHFLGLATLLPESGFGLVAGDHRQLAPILAHDWEREDRPPVESYQPHLSAFEAMAKLADDERVTDAALRRSALELSFRLPPRVIDLISRVYEQDEIELEGVVREVSEGEAYGEALWEGLWRGDAGLFLVVHDERSSRKANALEVEIVGRICSADGVPDASDVAVITPHRAQREMLRAQLGDRVDVVDTVERLQGGERRVVVVSGTASDPSAIAASAEFILDLNRSNVAFSRVRDRLIVVCASTLLDHIPADIEQYDETMLWKALRSTCSHLLVKTEVEGYEVRVLGPAREAGAEAPARAAD